MYDDDGLALTSADAAGAALSAYRRPVFDCGHCDSEAMQQFLDYAQPVDASFHWAWTRGRTRELAKVAHDSAPGKDGVPYRFWQFAPDIYHQTLDDIAELMQTGGDVPAPMHDASTAFVPKAEIGQDPELVRRTAGLTRPITLMNSSEKLLTIAVNSDLAEIADQCISQAPQGFAQGRLIDKNILDLDGALAALSVQQLALGVGVLIDFMQAFPPLADGWLFAVLSAMCFPAKLIAFVRSI